MAIKQYSFQIEKGESYAAYVKEAYGEDAQIVAVTQVKGRTPYSPAMVEVVVAVDDEDNKPKVNMKNKKAAIAYNKQAYNNEPIIIDELDIKPQNIDIKPQIMDIKPQPKKLGKVDNNLKSKDDKQLLNELNSKVEYLMSMRWGELAPARNNLAIPPEFAAIYNKAKNSDMLQSHLDEIMMFTLQNMPLSLYKNKDAIDRYFKILLKSMIPCRVDSLIRKQKIIMLVGPTGVGKTTTLAKLACRYAYGARKYKTAIISLDNFRLGAQEQLAEYAQLMRLPIRFVSSAEDLQKSLEELIGYEVVLIDSTGNSQYDKSKIEQLEGYLKASDKEIEVTLVLNAGMKYDDMEQTYKAFDVLKIETLIFTKFDETRAFGNIFSLIFNVKKPVSFFSTGQNVPEDIVVATSDYLIKCLLDGFEG